MLVEILEGKKKSRILIATFYMHSDNRIPSEPTGTRIHMLSGKPDLRPYRFGLEIMEIPVIKDPHNLLPCSPAIGKMS